MLSVDVSERCSRLYGFSEALLYTVGCVAVLVTKTDGRKWQRCNDTPVLPCLYISTAALAVDSSLFVRRFLSKTMDMVSRSYTHVHII